MSTQESHRQWSGSCKTRVQMKKLTLPLLLWAISAGIAQADIFRYVDSDGTVHFTNVPQDSRFKVYLKEKKTLDPVADTLAAEIHYYDEKARARYAKPILD